MAIGRSIAYALGLKRSHIRRGEHHKTSTRKEVKALARSFDADRAMLEHMPVIGSGQARELAQHFEKSKDEATRLLGKIPEDQRYDRKFRDDARRPKKTLQKSARSGVVLAAGLTSRAAAVIGAAPVSAACGIVKVVEVPISGIVGAFGGAIGGCIAGAELDVSVLKPVTAVGGLAAGAVVGAVVNSVETMTELPRVMAGQNSKAAATYRAIDSFDAARAHVKRKGMSTQAIAQWTQRSADSLAKQMERQATTLARRESEAMNHAVNQISTVMQAVGW